MIFLLFLILLGLGIYIFIQYQKHDKANKLYLEAKQIEKKDTKSPYDLTTLKQALALYKQCSKLVDKPEYVKDVKQCQRKIDDCYKFQDLLANGRKKAKTSYFREALQDFTEARRLFNTSELEGEISECQDCIKQQKNYEADLKQSAQRARQGRFQEAIDLLKPTLDKFSREDGQQLLTKLERVIQAKELYNSGLIVEKSGELNQAKTKYDQALNLLPEFDECKIRLSILAVKHNPKQAIFYLQAVEEGEQAAYIRGFAYAQLGKWQQADREWGSINKVSVDIQRSTLKKIIARDRLNSICEIEKLLDRGQLEIAKSVSLEFIEKFGLDTVVKFNLENHIQPILEKSIWHDGNWQKAVVQLEQIWLEQQDAKSLHNWAIATYYQAQTNPNKLTDFIIAWSTALANLDSNPILQNVHWLGSNSIDIENVSAKLKQILENAIDAVKDSNINEYLKLRDVYRREMVTLSLVKQDNCGVKIKQRLLILPGCYQRSRNYLPKISFPVKIWGALYTDWGLAVAACLEGDIARAIKIKPSRNPFSECDRFAYYFVSYHEGCHYLQNLEWRKAVKPLQQAKPEIKAKSDWCREIDRLCELQRQKIDDFDERLQFSQFWYELVDSQPSKSYFAEQQAIQVAQKLDDKKISLQQGLDELQKIRRLDPNNASTLNLINKVEYSLEAEKIDRLWRNGQYEEAVGVAKRSQNQDLRFKVAEICLEIIFKQLQAGNLSYEAIQTLNKIAQWAYELCPREPAFEPVF